MKEEKEPETIAEAMAREQEQLLQRFDYHTGRGPRRINAHMERLFREIIDRMASPAPRT